eukprot:702937-Prymnesium_polylepis.2
MRPSTATPTSPPSSPAVARSSPPTYHRSDLHHTASFAPRAANFDSGCANPCVARAGVPRWPEVAHHAHAALHWPRFL